MFKEGQKVWFSVWGWGEVSIVEDSGEYPIYVEFENGQSEWFTSSGALSLEGLRCLFFAEVIPPPEALNAPIEYKQLVVGDVVVMMNNEIKVVVEYSSIGDKTFLGADKLPRFLDDAYDRTLFLKDFIKKVIGNIND